MQKHVIKGNLKGFLCKDCSEPVFPAKVQLYLPWQEKQVLANVVADTKETFRLVSEKEAKQREKLLLAQTETDAEGNFRIEVDSKHAGSAFDIDFKCANVPRVLLGGIKGEPRPPQPPQQFHLTTFAPRWGMQKQAGNQQEAAEMLFKWEYVIPARWWCYIRGHFFDTWTICGQLRNCQTGQPIARATVEAWDADLISDDLLGSATTDVNGHFRIDYNSADFRRNAFPLNLETDPGIPFFSSGPDVYFKATLGGVTLLNEGKANRRNNVGYCLCVDLCTEANILENITDTFPSIWASIGDAFLVGWSGGPRHFDAAGYAGREKYVLSQTITFKGQSAIYSASGNPVEYRFLVSKSTTPNGSGIAPSFSPEECVKPADESFVPSVIGTLSPKDITLGNSVLVLNDSEDFTDANEGWFSLRNALERTCRANSINLEDYIWIPNSSLMSFDTEKLIPSHNIAGLSINAGEPFPEEQKIPIEKIAIRFEAREVIDAASDNYATLPYSGQTLNSVIVCNTLKPFIRLEVEDLSSNPCAPVSGDIYGLYTLYHPYLASFSIQLSSADNSIVRQLHQPPILPLRSNTNPAIVGGNNRLKINDPDNLITCNYTLEPTTINTRLHNGMNRVAITFTADDDLRHSFYYEASRR